MIEQQKALCRSCGAAIVWLPTVTGKKMPVNAEFISTEDKLFVHGLHKSHFATCPQADQHRRSR